MTCASASIVNTAILLTDQSYKTVCVSYEPETRDPRLETCLTGRTAPADCRRGSCRSLGQAACRHFLACVTPRSPRHCPRDRNPCRSPDCPRPRSREHGQDRRRFGTSRKFCFL